MTKMNILYLADPNSIHDIKWITYFSKDHNCFIISRDQKTHNPTLNLKELRINYVGSIKDYSTIKFWQNKPGVKKLEHLIQMYQIQLFHILYTEPNILWANYNNRFNIPIIASNRGTDILVTISNTIKSRSLLNYFVAKNYKKAFEQCDLVTCTSNSQLSTVKNLHLSKKSVLIRTGIDTELIDSNSDNDMNESISKPYILFPRNMRPVYNHGLALAAIAILPDQIKSDFEFIFIDSDSSDVKYVEKIKSTISSIVGVTIHFFNKLSQFELIPLIKNATLAVMTNLSDGSPVSAMEVMYLKTPLILSPLEYDAELFLDVRKFKDFTPKMLAKEITSVLNAQPTEKILDNNYRRILKKGNRFIEMQKLEQLYLDCIKQY